MALIDPSLYLKTPFLRGGRTLKGLDCYGFVRLILKEAGIDIPSFPCMTSGEPSEVDMVFSRVILVKVDRPSNYSLVYFCGRGTLAHVGVFLDGLIWHFGEEGLLSMTLERTFKYKIGGIYNVEGRVCQGPGDSL